MNIKIEYDNFHGFWVIVQKQQQEQEILKYSPYPALHDLWETKKTPFEKLEVNQVLVKANIEKSILYHGKGFVYMRLVWSAKVVGRLRMGLFGRMLRHMGMTLIKRTHQLPLLNLPDLLLVAKQDFQQMSRHLKSHTTTISCFCDSFMICIREASAGLNELSSISTATSIIVFFTFILSQMFSSVIHPQIMDSHSITHLLWHARILLHHFCSLCINKTTQFWALSSKKFP